MKENVFDVLMYLFDNYMDDDNDIPEQDTLSVELEQAGFNLKEINQAFDWLEDLATLQAQAPVKYQPTNAIRIYTAEEIEKLSVETRGFLMFLEQVEVLDSYTRELIIERMMSLDDEVDLEQLKWAVLMILFNIPGQENAASRMETLVYEDDVSMSSIN
mgnify:CR=1 FL=1|jgi:Smg protein|tara:strand:- start:3793 stop:4269 length:477 start_codon:yes stop_codon:yes gene_type:complete